MIRAVVFDLGGTLLDYNPRGLSWLEWERTGLESAIAFLMSEGYRFSEECFIHHFIGVLPERWERAAQGGENLKLSDILVEAAAECALTLSPDALEGAISGYVAPLDKAVTMYDDALDTLDALRERGLKMGLVSNTMWPAAWHQQELVRFGLAPYLDHTIFSSDVGVWKPQPEIYRLSLDALSVSPHEAMFVGDMLPHDILGAQGVGMVGVHKRNDNLSLEDVPIVDVRPDAAITRLAELPPLLDLW